MVDGVKIARRGYPGTPEARTWVSLKRGWTVTSPTEGEIPGARASTASLILSIVFLKVLWISDPTSMSAYWVARPWNKHLLPAK